MDNEYVCIISLLKIIYQYILNSSYWTGCLRRIYTHTMRSERESRGFFAVLFNSCSCPTKVQRRHPTSKRRGVRFYLELLDGLLAGYQWQENRSVSGRVAFTKGDVLLQLTTLGEGLLAVTTSIRLLISMRVHVELQVGQLVERLLAHVTFVRLLACVYQDVVSQVAFLVETFATDRTGEFFDVAVRPKMRLQR